MAMIDYLILVPTDEEFSHAKEVWEKVEPNNRVDDIQEFNSYRFLHRSQSREPWGQSGEALVVIVPMGGMGLTWSGLVASQAMRMWKPANVVIVGIAGSLVGKDLALGDVIVPDRVVGYQIGDVIERRPSSDEKGAEKAERAAYLDFTFRKTQAKPSLFLINTARALALDQVRLKSWQKRAKALNDEKEDYVKPPDVHVGERESLASGNFVVKSEIFAARLRDGDRQLKAVEMEAMGLFDAQRPLANAPVALIVRGISDFADGNKETLDTHGTFRRAAMRSAMQFVMDLIDMRLGQSAIPSAERLVLREVPPANSHKFVVDLGLTPRGKDSVYINSDPLIRVEDAMTEIFLQVSPSENRLNPDVQLALRQARNGWTRLLRPTAENGQWTWRIERSAEPYDLSIAIVVGAADKTLGFKISAVDEFRREAAITVEPG